MRLLGIFAITFSMVLTSCTQKGPLTPTEAFLALQEIYRHQDDKGFNKILSDNSRLYIKKIAFSLTKLDPTVKKNLIELIGAPEHLFDNLDENNYAKIYFTLNKKYRQDIISATLKQKTVSISLEGDLARFKMSNNVDLYFIKEAPYWKFDYEKSMQ